MAQEPLPEPPALTPDPFGTIAPTYDHMGFLTLTAQHLVRRAGLQPGEQVLDVATGTGSAALEAARAVGPAGRVVGLDLSAAMLEQARERAAGTPTVIFVGGNAMQLPFPDASFGAVLCASGLFFMPDLVAALREWGRVLRRGGKVCFTAFDSGLMAPLPALWAACLAPHGLKAPGPPMARLPTAGKARELLEEAGFSEIQAGVEPVRYLLERPEDRWDDIESGLEGLPRRSLPAETAAAIRAAHLSELHALFGGQPLTVTLPLIVAFGTR